MLTRTSRQGCVLVILATTALGIVGCPDLLLQSFFGELVAGGSAYNIVGVDGDRMVYTKTAVPSTRSTTYPPSDVQYVDLTTLVDSSLATGVPSLPESLAASVRWIAWNPATEGPIAVRDLAIGTDVNYLPATSDQVEVTPLAVLSDNLLVVHRTTSTSSSASNQAYEFVVIDLVTGLETHVTNASSTGGGFAIAGDTFVFTNGSSTNVEPRSLEYTFNLDAVNLATGDRVTIAPDIRTSEGAGLCADGGFVYWLEYKSGGFHARVRQYDPATGDITTVVDDLNGADNDIELRLVGVHGSSALAVRASRVRPLTEIDTLTLEGFDGSTTKLDELWTNLFNSRAVLESARFVGEFVVWVDPAAKVFRIYDPRDQSLRSYDPTTR